ncbi:MAG TPA: glycosyltransferase family 4 protein [Vicinamibacterales bacterium]|nr:glycosyltransferase family 4 protein [Vicinamibacterales bacterium]
MTATRPVRVCFFNRSYWPDTGATGQLLTELAEDLVSRHGLVVTVVSGLPRNTVPAPAARETRNGVEVIRARGTTFDPRRFVGRALNYLTYFCSALVAALRLPAQDVVVAMTDPPIIGLAAIAACRRRTRFVLFCQDIFPEVATLLEDFKSPLVNRILDRINRVLIDRADRIVALGDRMARRLIEEKGADAARVVVIHNWADVEAIVPSPRDNAFAETHGLTSRFVILHAGNIGQGQNLDRVIAAAGILRDEPRVEFVFIGDGTRRAALVAEVESRSLPNVRFLGFQPRSEMRWTYASADVCLISLKPGLSGYIVPSKLYPILAAGRALIAAVDADSEVAMIAEQFKCGVVVANDDPQALADAIRTLVNDPARVAAMGARSRDAALHYSRERQVAAHATLLTSFAPAP